MTPLSYMSNKDIATNRNDGSVEALLDRGLGGGRCQEYKGGKFPSCYPLDLGHCIDTKATKVGKEYANLRYLRLWHSTVLY
jgi:hypothetical protein